MQVNEHVNFVSKQSHLAAENALMPAGLTPDCSMAADQPSTVRVTASLLLLLLLKALHRDLLCPVAL
jgi:hypothetical protein